MAAPKKKQVEANDGSYGGMVLAAFDDLGTAKCPKCDDTDTICLCCDQSIIECDCGEDQEPCACDACHGGAAEPTGE